MKRMKIFAIITVMVFTMGALIGCGDVEDALASIPTDAITIAEAETNETATDDETDLKKTEPVQTKEPASTEKPAQTEKTATTEEPVQTEEPTETEKPTATEEPVQTEKPAATEKPIQTEKPAATEKPVQTEKPAATEKPVENKTEQSSTPAVSQPVQNTPAQNTEPAKSEPAQSDTSSAPAATPAPTPVPQPVHEHVWKEHTATTQTWIPNVVVVEDYETQYVTVGEKYICNCGYETTDPDSIRTHVKENYRAGNDNCINFTIQNVYGEQQVLVGTHEEDQGHYETTSYVDYYYCECGTTKN